MLYVDRSHRTEELLEGLAERLTRPRPDPLSPSIVVVQGQGMERWIAQSIAEAHGACANVDFLFPRRLIDGVFQFSESISARNSLPADEPPVAANAGWEMDQLVWAIARRIAADESAPELAPLARQLGNADRDWRLIQLSHQIASRFDDYITYRPDWLARWSLEGASRPASLLGEDEAWQGWLYRRLREDLGPGHFADRALNFRASVDADTTGLLQSEFARKYKNGVDAFAVSTLPPLYLEVLDQLAQLIDVRLSVLTPSRHYWADLWGEVRAESEDDSVRMVAASASPPIDPSNSIAGFLSGLGRLGGDFQRTLEQVSAYVELEGDRFEEPDSEADPDASLLERFQSRIRDLDEGRAIGRGVSAGDRSLHVHLCHGPKRELEAVEAALRDAFDRDPTLTPEDVIVMSPDIDSLAPTIEAVFGSGGAGSGGEDAIPYRVADRSTLHRSPVAEAFVALLGLLTGRAGRSEIIDWLALEPAHRRLGLDADGVDRLGDWAARAGIRFGLDDEHRAALGLEKSRRHSWAGGIDRLVLGHALGSTGEIAAGITPEPLDLFSDPSLLGAIGELETTLSEARQQISESRPVGEWSEWLEALLAASLDHRDDNSHEHGLLRAALQGIASAASGVGFEDRIPFEAMRERFVRAMEAAPAAQGFLAGGVTFCELVPLRAIPFRIIAIVGLSDTHFPRRQPAASYDLIARYPRSGDRNARSDDRYLFLEALMSTRDQLILTVPSRDLRDGSELPPSVVVSELLDTLDSCFEMETIDPSKRVRDHVIVEHPIHSFSARYFDVDGDPRLIGLDGEAFDGAQKRLAAMAAGGGSIRRFLEPLSEATGPEADSSPLLHLDEMTRRLLRSTRVFARERLGLRLPRPERAVGDFDPHEFDALDRFGLGAALLEDRRRGATEEETVSRLTASARLPGGEAGRLAAKFLLAEVRSVSEIASSRLPDARLPDHAFELHLDDVPHLGSATISGVIRDLFAEGPMRLEFSRLSGRAELAFWIQHLVVCALAREGADLTPVSVLIARPEAPNKSGRVVTYRDVPNAKSELATLFEWAWSVDRAPLPFFPRTSRVFADGRAKLAGQGQDDQPWNAAYLKLYGGDTGNDARPEIEEELETLRVWEGSRPLESGRDENVLFGFDCVSERFFATLLAHREIQDR